MALLSLICRPRKPLHSGTSAREEGESDLFYPYKIQAKIDTDICLRRLSYVPLIAPATSESRMKLL